MPVGLAKIEVGHARTPSERRQEREGMRALIVRASLRGGQLSEVLAAKLFDQAVPKPEVYLQELKGQTRKVRVQECSRIPACCKIAKHRKQIK